MIRKSKLYVRPRKLYERSRIQEENQLMEKYGLKNKRDIWKTLAKVSYFRRRAKSLAKASREEQEVLFSKLQSIGIKVSSTADVLALTPEDILRRRFQSVLVKKGLAHTMKHARQLIVHKKVAIGGAILNIPSYLVPIKEEETIALSMPSLRTSEKASTKENSSENIPESTREGVA